MTTPPEPLSFAHVTARIMKIFKAVTVVGTGGALVLGGWKLAAGFLLGALISGINFYWLHKLVASLGTTSRPRFRTVVLGFRYLILGGGAYVIVRLSQISLPAMLFGLFALTAAVFVDVVFEIVYAESELWITGVFNDYLSAPANAVLRMVGMKAEPRPWADFIVMELVVVALLMLVVAILRPRLSVEKPGGLQHIFEMFYEFLKGQATTQVGHTAQRYLPFFGTLFLFILTSNLIGLIPCFETPTMNPSVTAGCAFATFAYYNLAGVIAQGPLRYLGHFAGPIWWLAPLMFPIEIISHTARLLSLTVRLYANMFAGEQVTLVFLNLTKFLAPVAFMGLHIFVGVIQAYIFMLLTMVYVGMAVSHDH